MRRVVCTVSLCLALATPAVAAPRAHSTGRICATVCAIPAGTARVDHPPARVRGDPWELIWLWVVLSLLTAGTSIVI